jgi:hypothetical protein
MNHKTRIFASTFGAIIALAGVEHGIGEIFQGNSSPQGLMILSWPNTEFFTSLAGEPAMTLIPSYLISGIVTLLVSLALLMWAIKYVQRKNGGWVMIFLSIALLLVGGGIFPPVFGVLIGAVATRINVKAASKRVNRPARFQHFLAKLWPWSYAACIISWLLLLPGVPLIDFFIEKNITTIILAVMVLVLSTLFLTLISGFAHDKEIQAGIISPNVKKVC